ncbi:MAG: TatD family hydrolase [Bacteroidota bacterium]
MLIDTHVHLYHRKYDADRTDVVGRAKHAGVTRLLLPATDVSSIHEALTLCEAYPGAVFAMAGIHPSDVNAATDADREAVASLVGDARVVAVGESGLDYYWDRSYNDKQHDFLRWHARLAIDSDLPLVLHNRDQKGSDACSHDLVAILREVRDAHPHGERLRGVFHCFGGPPWLTQAVLDLGFHVGIGGTLTFKKSGVAEAIAEVPLDRIVLETDGPYLAPVPHRGQRNEPAYVRLVATHLAEVRGTALEHIAEQTTRNATRLFRLPESAQNS